MALRLRLCACGRAPTVKAERVAEDCYETYVRCDCGTQSEYVEGPYSEPSMAASLWNDGFFEVQTPAPPPSGEET